MKDQYVADVNDFLKYGLLRALTADSLLMGVVWMLTPGDGRSDGLRLSYITHADRYRSIDPGLFDALTSIVGTNDRSVIAIERARVLRTRNFASAPVPDESRAREEYFERALSTVAECDLVFFDPDNGFAVASVPKGRRNSSKYVYWDEVVSTYIRGHSVVVYQHFPRRPRAHFLAHLRDTARSLTSCPHVWFFQTSHVVFVILPQPRHIDVLEPRLDEFGARAMSCASVAKA